MKILILSLLFCLYYLFIPFVFVNLGDQNPAMINAIANEKWYEDEALKPGEDEARDTDQDTAFDKEMDSAEEVSGEIPEKITDEIDDEFEASPTDEGKGDLSDQEGSEPSN